MRRAKSHSDAGTDQDGHGQRRKKPVGPRDQVPVLPVLRDSRSWPVQCERFVGHDDARLTDADADSDSDRETDSLLRGVVAPNIHTWSTGGCIASGGGGHGELRAHFQRCELGGTSCITLMMMMMMMMTMRSNQASTYPQLHGASIAAACDGTSDGDGDLMAPTLAKAHA